MHIWSDLKENISSHVTVLAYTFLGVQKKCLRVKLTCQITRHIHVPSKFPSLIV